MERERERERERDGTDNVVFEVGGGAVLLGLVADSKKKIHPTAHFLLFSLLIEKQRLSQRVGEREEGDLQGFIVHGLCNWGQNQLHLNPNPSSPCGPAHLNFIFFSG
jgi:hypothetical protein